MSITIIIVNWNSGVLLSMCLEHLARQTVQPDKILVLDNASTDNSMASTIGYGNVVVRAMETNLGFAAGNNHALAECNTEYVALLNPDTFPKNDWLERLLVAAAANPKIAMFGSRQLCQSKSDILDGIGDIYHCSGLVWRDRCGSRQRESDLIAKEIFSPCAAAALYRRRALLDAGGFDKDHFCYVEDIDLGFRLRLAGHTAMYVPDAVVHHVGSGTTGGRHSDFSIYHGHRNLVWTYIKNMPGALFWLYLPLHITANVCVVIGYAMRGRLRLILRAKIDAIKGIPRMWRKRRLIQAHRRASISDIWRVLDKNIWPSQLNRDFWR